MSSEFLTLPQAARLLGVSHRQAEYASERYRVEGSGRFANVRVFTGDDIALLRGALQRTGAISAERQNVAAEDARD